MVLGDKIENNIGKGKLKYFKLPQALNSSLAATFFFFLKKEKSTYDYSVS